MAKLWHAASLRRFILFCGCQFCYCREEEYYPYQNVIDFVYVVQV